MICSYLQLDPEEALTKSHHVTMCSLWACSCFILLYSVWVWQGSSRPSEGACILGLQRQKVIYTKSIIKGVQLQICLQFANNIYAVICYDSDARSLVSRYFRFYAGSSCRALTNHNVSGKSLSAQTEARAHLFNPFQVAKILVLHFMRRFLVGLTVWL